MQLCTARGAADDDAPTCHAGLPPGHRDERCANYGPIALTSRPRWQGLPTGWAPADAGLVGEHHTRRRHLRRRSTLKYMSRFAASATAVMARGRLLDERSLLPQFAPNTDFDVLAKAPSITTIAGLHSRRPAVCKSRRRQRRRSRPDRDAPQRQVSHAWPPRGETRRRLRVHERERLQKELEYQR
jgi:hypothetical protein